MRFFRPGITNSSAERIALRRRNSTGTIYIATTMSSQDNKSTIGTFFSIHTYIHTCCFHSYNTYHTHTYSTYIKLYYQLQNFISKEIIIILFSECVCIVIRAHMIAAAKECIVPLPEYEIFKVRTYVRT
jgi:hypothetical protein